MNIQKGNGKRELPITNEGLDGRIRKRKFFTKAYLEANFIFYDFAPESGITPCTVSPNHVVCDVNFWYHRQLNNQQEASPRNFNQS